MWMRAAADGEPSTGPDAICRRWTAQRGTPALPLLWYQESTAFAATLKAKCPSYDAIAGRQPASSSVSESSCIDFYTVIEELHLEVLVIAASM
jgi:hypothetical protein